MNFVTKEQINKGWSSDKKYCVTDENGTRYLLRVSDIAQNDTKQSEFNMMKQVASFGVPMCQPIEFGTCDEGVYYAWVDDCFRYADKIYVLDISKRVYIYRIIKRTIKRKLGLERGKKETLKSVYNLLKWTDTFQNKSMPEIRKILSGYPEKTIWLHTSREVQKIIKGDNY